MRSTQEQLEQIQKRATRLERKAATTRVVVPASIAICASVVLGFVVLPLLKNANTPEDIMVLGAYGSLVIVSPYTYVAILVIIIVLLASFLLLLYERHRNSGLQDGDAQ